LRFRRARDCDFIGFIKPPTDLTWLFWTKLCEKLSLERSFGYAEEEVQR
jgi:hypothetical protein